MAVQGKSLGRSETKNNEAQDELTKHENPIGAEKQSNQIHVGD